MSLIQVYAICMYYWINICKKSRQYICFHTNLHSIHACEREHHNQQQDSIMSNPSLCSSNVVTMYIEAAKKCAICNALGKSHFSERKLQLIEMAWITTLQGKCFHVMGFCLLSLGGQNKGTDCFLRDYWFSI